MINSFQNMAEEFATSLLGDESLYSKESFNVLFNNTTLTPKQKEVFNCKAPFIILSGAVRSGKTHVLILKLLEYLFTNKNKVIIMTGASRTALMRNIIYPLQDLVCGIDSSFTVTKNANEFTLNTNKVYLFGTDNSRSWSYIRGLTADAWIGNEITTHDYEAVQECIKRVSKADSLILWDTNPDSPNHWVYQEFIKVKNHRQEVYSFTIYDNKQNIPPHFIQNLEKSYEKTPYLASRYLNGEWVAAEGSPFANIYIGEWDLPKVEIVFVDPAGGGESKTALSYVLRNIHNGLTYYYVLGRVYEKPYYECYNEILRDIMKYKPSRVVIEENLTYGHFSKDMSLYQKQYGFKVIPVRNSLKKIERICGLAPLVDRGEIQLSSYSDEAYIADIRDFNLKNPQHSDAPDSLESAIRFLVRGAKDFNNYLL